MFNIFTLLLYPMFRAIRVRLRVKVVNTTFNNISDISWLSVLLVKETGRSTGKIPDL